MQKSRGWKFARIHKVDIFAHFSLVFLIFYIFVVASAQFPYVVEQSGVNPSQLHGSSEVWSGLFALGLFISILLHEFGHVLMAQSLGVKVRSVTLMILGGISEMGRVPEQHFGEFKVAIVGPLVSFAIGGILWIVGRQTSSADLALFSYWIARLNFVLGVFNLIPAIPLDGGRALRSLLSFRMGSALATRHSVRVAKVLSWALGIAGLYEYNLLLIFVAVFIYLAADRELVVLNSRNILKGVKVGQVGREVNGVDEDNSILIAADRMSKIRSRVLPVITRDGSRALLTLEAIKGTPEEEWSTHTVAQILEKVEHVLDRNDDLSDVFSELLSNRVMLFQNRGQVVGVIELQDLVDAIDFRSIQMHLADEARGAA